MAVAFGLLVLRLGVGLIVAAHGAQKLFAWWGGPGMANWAGAMARMRMRPPVAWAWISALSELAGGLAVAIGFLSPLGNIGVIGSMLVAVALVHLPKGFWVSKGGFEFNLTLIAGAVAIAFTGPGAYSLDSLLGIRLPEPLALIAGTVALVLGVGAALGTRAPKPVEQRNPQVT